MSLALKITKKCFLKKGEYIEQYVVGFFSWLYNTNDVNTMIYLPVVLIIIMLILLCFLAIFKWKPEDICKISEPQDFSDYDSEGYNR